MLTESQLCTLVLFGVTAIVRSQLTLSVLRFLVHRIFVRIYVLLHVSYSVVARIIAMKGYIATPTPKIIDHTHHVPNARSQCQYSCFVLFCSFTRGDASENEEVEVSWAEDYGIWATIKATLRVGVRVNLFVCATRVAIGSYLRFIRFR